MLLPEIVNKGDVEFVHVSGGRELLLKPGLNIIGGLQPRGVNEVIAGDMLGIPDMLGMPDMGIVDEVRVISFEGDEVGVGAIIMSSAIDIVTILDPSMRDLLSIPDMLIEGVFVGVPSMFVDEESSPRPVPAWRM